MKPRGQGRRKASRNGKPLPKRALPPTLAAAPASTPLSVAVAVLAALRRPAGAGPPGPDASKLDHVADALVNKACAGDVQAIRAVFERIDGKVTSDKSDAAPSTIVIVHTFKSKI